MHMTTAFGAGGKKGGRCCLGQTREELVRDAEEGEFRQV